MSVDVFKSVFVVADSEVDSESISAEIRESGDVLVVSTVRDWSSPHEDAKRLESVLVTHEDMYQSCTKMISALAAFAEQTPEKSDE